METRLMPTNAVLDLALADGLNPAPLAAAGWQVVCLEVPVLTELGTVVCDVVLFNVGTGHLLVVEAKSGANIEPDQARKLAAIDPQALIIAGGVTVPQAVRPTCEVLFACLARHATRITQGLAAAGLSTPALAVDAIRHISRTRRWRVPTWVLRWARCRPGPIRLPGSSPSTTSRPRTSSTDRSRPSWLQRWPGDGLP